MTGISDSARGKRNNLAPPEFDCPRCGDDCHGMRRAAEDLAFNRQQKVLAQRKELKRLNDVLELVRVGAKAQAASLRQRIAHLEGQHVD